MTPTVHQNDPDLPADAAAAFLRILAFKQAGPNCARAQAQAPGSEARMQKERATCDGVQQDRAACLREAGAARQEAGRNGLTSAGPGGYDANALRALPRTAGRRSRRLRSAHPQQAGAGRTTTEGSVMGGGVIRETVTPLPAQPAPAS